jgi:tetratricopeptide (TPR) repeat protein
MLAHTCEVVGQPDKAEAEYLRVLELDPFYGNAANSLLFLYSDQGEDEKAIALIEKFPARAARFNNFVDTAACIYYKLGRLDDALSKYRDALEIDPNWFVPHMGMAWVYGLKEQYGEALGSLDKYLAGDHSNKWQGHFAKSFFLSWLGRWRESLDELQKTKEIMEGLGAGAKLWLVAYHAQKAATDLEREDLGRSRQDIQDYLEFLELNFPYEKAPIAYFPNFYFAGWLQLKEGNLDAAKANLDKLRSLLSEHKELDNDYQRYPMAVLESEIVLAEGSREKAIEIFRQAPSIGWMNISHQTVGSTVSYNTPYLKDVSARAYLKIGEVGKAIAEYERLTTFDPKNPERRLIHPLYHYRLAKLYKQKGNKAKARARYERFLELWKDADPGQAEVDDAKARLAAQSET